MFSLDAAAGCCRPRGCDGSGAAPDTGPQQDRRPSKGLEDDRRSCGANNVSLDQGGRGRGLSGAGPLAQTTSTNWWCKSPTFEGSQFGTSGTETKKLSGASGAHVLVRPCLGVAAGGRCLVSSGLLKSLRKPALLQAMYSGKTAQARSL